VALPWVGGQKLAGWSVFYVFIEPAEHLVDKLFVGFEGGVPMGLVRQDNETRGAAVAANGFVKLGGLDGSGAWVSVFGAMTRSSGVLILSAKKNGETLR